MLSRDGATPALARVALPLLAVGALAGCGPSSPPSPSASTAAPSPVPVSAAATAAPATTAPVTECAAAQLEGVMLTTDGAAGSSQAGFEVRNNGSAPCTLHGYFDINVVDGNGHTVSLAQQQWSSSTAGPPATVTLGVGTAALNSGNDAGHAIFYLQWTDNCQPGQAATTPAQWLVAPPAQAAAFTIAARAADGNNADPLPICGGTITVGQIEPRGGPRPF